MLRRTLVQEVVVDGVGLHTGAPAQVRLGPAPFGEGVSFWVDGVRVPARLPWAEARPGGTVLAKGGARVVTPEHVLAAFRGLGVSDGQLWLEGPELPALDGAAAAWMQALRRAGLREGPPWALRTVAFGRFEGHGGELVVSPMAGPRPSVRVEVDFPDGPHGAATWDHDPDGFEAEVAWARTFVMADQVEALRAAGRGRGALPANTRVISRRRAGTDDEGAAEAVAHKLLDAVGDLALVEPLRADVVVRRGSHRLHIDGLRALVGGRPEGRPLPQ